MLGPSLIDAWLTHWADPLGPQQPRPRPSLPPKQFGRLFLLAEKHGVLAALLRNATSTPESSPEETTLLQAKARHHATIGFGLMLLQHANAAVELFGGLPAMIVKGPVFARRLYPERGLRRFTDIDILADDDAIPVLAEPLGQLGFRLVECEPKDDPQEWKWSHRDRTELVIEVHKNLVHPLSLRAAVSLRYRDIASEASPGMAELPSTLMVVAGVHGATHNFERLLHVSDILQAARALATATEESRLERLIGRTRSRFAVVAGLDLAGRLFGEDRCFAIARALRPVRYIRGARWLVNRAVVTSTMDRRRHVYSWRRTIFRELLKRPQ
jgi:hypothetical protein